MTAPMIATMMRWPMLAQWPRATLSTTSMTAAMMMPPTTAMTSRAVQLDWFTRASIARGALPWAVTRGDGAAAELEPWVGVARPQCPR